MVLHDTTFDQLTDLPTFTRSEMRKVNYLIQKALLSSNVQERLLQSDVTLRTEFDIPSHVWHQLANVNATSITDFCGAILRLQGESYR